MQPHQERAVKEKEELDEKLTKLNAFFGTEIFKALPPEEQDRLGRQRVVMALYSQILGERIAAF